MEAKGIDIRKGNFIMEISVLKDYELERYITEIMLDIGVPAHLKGYHYLRDAIMMSGRDMEVVSSVTKLLYPAIARRFRTTDQKVERAIRNAIEVSWTRGNAETFEKMIGYSTSVFRPVGQVKAHQQRVYCKDCGQGTSGRESHVVESSSVRGKERSTFRKTGAAGESRLLLLVSIFQMC